MDRLSEIRARCEAARPVVFVDVPIRAESRVFLEHAKSDMTYLLAEVERLTARAEKAEAERDAAYEKGFENGQNNMLEAGYVPKGE